MAKVCSSAVPAIAICFRFRSRSLLFQSNCLWLSLDGHYNCHCESFEHFDLLRIQLEAFAIRMGLMTGRVNATFDGLILRLYDQRRKGDSFIFAAFDERA
jgi:hypothetical protein